MRRARTEHRFRIGYTVSRYELPAFAWTQSSFIQPQMMVEDRYFYDPAGWYFPQAYRLDEHGRLLLMAPGMDRSGAVGFRCVEDAN